MKYDENEFVNMFNLMLTLNFYMHNESAEFVLRSSLYANI